jgi:glutaredoxin 1
MKVEIYGASSCNYCTQAVQLCETRDIEYNYIDVGSPENLQTLEGRIGSKVRTIPQIFINGDFVPGGYMGLRQTLAGV